MYRNTITLIPEAPNYALKPVWVGTASGALFVFDGIPYGAVSVRLYVTRVGATEAVYFDATYDEAKEEWYAYAGGANFPTAGQGSYEVGFTDDVGRTFWCGRGLLTVTAASGGGDAGAGTPAEQYVRDPEDGLYYKLQIMTNDLGQKTLTVAQEGVSLV